MLKESYVIFLCLDDVFGKGHPVYRFENLCCENPDIKLDDKAYKIFFNASMCDTMKNEEQKEFFNFLLGKNADSVFTQKLSDIVENTKHNFI